MAIDPDTQPNMAWQNALSQKQSWDKYKREFFAKYGKYPLGAKNLGQFTARYARKDARQAARNATGQGYRDWKAAGWGAEAASAPSAVAFSDAQMLSRGKYRRGRVMRRRRVYRKRGAYGTRKFASDMNNIGRAFGNLGRRMTKKSHRSSMANYGAGLARQAIAQRTGLSGTGLYTTGSGSYHTMGNTTSTNALIEGSMASVPSFTSLTDEQGDVIVTHSEYVRDIYGNAAGENFINFGLSLNPGLEATFPWLSQLAQNFDEYVMIQCMFTFRSTMTSVISSTAGQVGNVVMVTDYNPTKPIFDDKMRMMQYDGSQSGKITKDALHGVECDPRKLSGAEGKRVRTKPVLVDGDKMDYDLGTFQLAISNTPDVIANSTIGELWVSYRVLLRKPKFYSTLGLGISRSDYTSKDLDAAGAVAAVNKYDLWGKGWNGVYGYPLAGQQNSISFHVQSVLANMTKANNPTLFPQDLWHINSEGQPESTLNSDGDAIPAGSAFKCSTLIVFPGHVSGKYEILLSQETAWDAVSSNGSFEDIAMTGGNVTPIFDLHQGGAAGADVASFVKVADQTNVANPGNATGNTGTGGPLSISRVVILHVNVEVASNGKDNTLVIFSPLTAGKQFARNDLRIQEYNSYDTFQPPEFVNSQNIIQTTTTSATGPTVGVDANEHHGRRFITS